MNEKPKNPPKQDQPDKREDIHFVPSNEPAKNEPTPERAKEEKARRQK